MRHHIPACVAAGWLNCLCAAVLLLVCGGPWTATAQGRASDDEAGRPYVAYHSPREYGAPNQNFAVTQDARGIIYAANRSGVLEYDGESWRLLPSPDDRTVWNVVVHPGGRLFVAGDGFIGSIGIGPEGGPPRIRVHNGELPPGEQSIGEVRQSVVVDSAVYFGAPGRLYRWTERAGLEAWGEPGRFGRMFAVEGRLYVHDRDRGLMQGGGQGLRPVAGGETFAGKRLYMVLSAGRQGLLVGVQDEGLYRGTEGRFTRFATAADEAFGEVEVASGTRLPGGLVAVATSGGVFLLDDEGDVVERVDRSAGLRNDIVEQVFVDRQGGMWLALQNGLARVETPSALTRFDEVDLQGLESIVRHEGRLYVSVRIGLLVLQPSARPGAFPSFAAVEGLTTECYGLLSTPQGLLAGCEGGVFIVRDGRAERIRPSIAAVALVRSRRDTSRVFVGEASGLGLLRLERGSWRDEGSVPGPRGFVRHVAEDADGTVWIATRLYGLQRIRLEGTTPVSVEMFGVRDGLAEGRLRVFSFDGRLIFATPGGLRRLSDDGGFVPDTTFGQALARGDRIVSRFTQGPGGTVCLVTDAGIVVARRGPDGPYRWQEEPFKRMPRADIYAVYPESDGVIWAGGAEDLVRYDARRAPATRPDFDTLLRRVTLLASDSVLVHGAASADASAEAGGVRLPYRWNALRFEYAAPRFVDPGSNEYQVRLDGLDDGWSGWQPERRRVYDRLGEGAYTFRVRARDRYGVVGNEATFTFVVLPPWWRTIWAYLGYLLLGMVAVRLVDRVQAGRVRRVEREKARLREAELKAELAEERAAGLQELNALRSRFFTGISHEFRTPLTLIMGPLEDLLERSGDELSDMTHAEVTMALRNVRRLHHLTNQLLDAARLEAGRMELHPQSADLARYLRELTASFTGVALKNRSDFTVEIPDTPLRAPFDPDQLEKVFVNLLANAFKFTPAGGAIRVSLTEEAGQAVARVFNEGPEIPPEELPHLFERFYRTGGSEESGQVGSGIGLSLVKDIVELHGGTVEAESQAGAGTTFTVRLPLADEEPGSVAKPSEEPRRFSAAAAETVAASLVVGEDVPKGDEWEEDARSEGEDVPTVLVVDDSADIRRLIRSRLERRFRVVEAPDGRQGLDAARQWLPDLILSDVMMPEMGGYELCRAVKEDPELAFIPVVLLTAMAAVEDRIEGRKEGADAYLAKPFDKRELDATIDALILRQRRLKERLEAQRDGEPERVGNAASMASADAPEPAFLVEDEVLTLQIRSVVEEHLSDEDLSVDRMAAALGMSRATLYRHTMRLMNMSPSVLLRTLRLERAAALLGEHLGSVSEVAYAVGFKSLSHFSQAFRDHFGVSPSQHANDAVAGGAETDEAG